MIYEKYYYNFSYKQAAIEVIGIIKYTYCMKSKTDLSILNKLNNTTTKLTVTFDIYLAFKINDVNESFKNVGINVCFHFNFKE